MEYISHINMLSKESKLLKSRPMCSSLCTKLKAGRLRNPLFRDAYRPGCRQVKKNSTELAVLLCLVPQSV